MQSDFFESSGGGDASIFQNLIWYFGHPEAWLTFFKWIFIGIAIIIIARRLFKARRVVSLAVFLVAVIGALYYNFYLMKQAQQLFIEGRGHEVIALRIVNWATLLMSFAAVVWMIILQIKKKS